MRFKAIIAIVVVVVVAVLILAAKPADARTVALWKMNETRGDVLKDAAHNFRGHIGKRVGLNGQSHFFSRLDGQAYAPQHIDWVPDDDRLDPGDAPFAVTAYIKYGPRKTKDRNVVQKGQGSPAGGMFKMKTNDGDEPLGMIKCLFRGSGGDSSVNSSSIRRIDNDRWHTVTCKRTLTGTVMQVDGRVVDRNPNDPGTISNNYPVAIGGNTFCQTGDSGKCNYWAGRIGFIRIEKP